MRPPILFLLRTWLWKHRGLFLVTLAALAVRLWWNLFVHRPTDFAYSDMGGYLDRGNQMIDQPEAKGPWLALYPFGTHFFIGGLRWLFGRKNDAAIGAGFAVLGTLAVTYTYATATRFITRAWARRLVGVVLVAYYPWIGLGGYTLSEIPFTFCVAGTAFYGLRLADEGRRGDAWLLGLFFGLGAVVRPQILVAAVFLGIHFLFRRRAWRRFTPGLVLRAAAPLAVILALSGYRLQQHTGAWGLISTNGPLNFVFGRCHNTGLEAVTPNSRGFFGPPALGSLLHYERMYARTHRDKPWFTLDPAFGERGEKLTISAHMWDAGPNYQLARSCVAKTGYLRQIKYAVTHVVLLWGYNFIWPDMGQKPQWSRPMEMSCLAHNYVFVAPLFAALALSFQRRRARWMLLSVHVFSVLVMSMLYFGDTRYRAPYDGLIILLATAVYLEVGRLLQAGIERLHGWRAQRRSSSRATSSSPPGSASGTSAPSAAASAASLIR